MEKWKVSIDKRIIISLIVGMFLIGFLFGWVGQREYFIYKFDKAFNSAMESVMK